jgi:carboxylate-amine ligase
LRRAKPGPTPARRRSLQDAALAPARRTSCTVSPPLTCIFCDRRPSDARGRSALIPHAFGQSEAWSVGLEEELFSLAEDTLEPAPFPTELLDGTRLKAELFAAVVELNTGICLSVAEAVEELGELRQEAKRRAAQAGLVLAAAGTWPIAISEEEAITDNDGYRRFVEYAGSSARRQYCCGLHVHVGMESPEACMETMEAVLPWLPLVLAVSANSPYRDRRETGLVSARAEILTLLPRSGAPPVFPSYAEWEAFAERLVALGLADEYTRIWWDIRPHPRYGTLEIRMPDQPTGLESTEAVASLIHALVASSKPNGAADRGSYAENRWAALRFGREARLIHPAGERLATVSDLLDGLTGRLGADVVEPVRGLDQAAEQLRLGRGEGLHSLCRRLVEAT